MADSGLMLLPFRPAGFSAARILLAPALVRVGLRPVQLAPGIRHDSLVAALEQVALDARIAIAFLADRSPNVLFELGVVVALRRPLIVVANDRRDAPDFVAHVVPSSISVNELATLVQMTARLPPLAGGSTILQAKLSARSNVVD